MSIKEEVLSFLNRIIGNPTIHGWLLIAGGVTIFLHLLNIIKFINYLVHYIFFILAVYMFIRGAMEVNLISKIKDLFYWAKSLISK